MVAWFLLFSWTFVVKQIASLSTLEVYSPPLPFDWMNGMAAVYNHQLYVFGGSRYNPSAIVTGPIRTLNLNDGSNGIWENHWTSYDPNIPSDTMSYYANNTMYDIASGQHYVIINNLMYMISPTGSEYSQYGNMIIFDMNTFNFINSSTYSYSLEISGGRLSKHCVCQNGSHIFSISGLLYRTQFGSAEYISNTFIYDIRSDVWIDGPSIPLFRYNGGCSNSYNNTQLFYFGGEDASSNTHDTIFMYDTTGDIWSIMNITLTKNRRFQQCLLSPIGNGEIICVSGTWSTDTTSSTYGYEIEVFDPYYESIWISNISMYKGVSYFSTAIDYDTNIFYVLGGRDANFYNLIQYGYFNDFVNPTNEPTNAPTNIPTNKPTDNPTIPTESPTNKPSMSPINEPTDSPRLGETAEAVNKSVFIYFLFVLVQILWI
eukprot:481672_1